MSDEPVMPPVHPGTILREEFLEPLGITERELASAIDVPHTLISDIIDGRSDIPIDVGMRLSRHFGMSEGFWTGLQRTYEGLMASDRRLKLDRSRQGQAGERLTDESEGRSD